MRHSSGFKGYTRLWSLEAISELAAGAVVLVLIPGKWAKAGSGDLAEPVRDRSLPLGVQPPGLAGRGGGAGGGQGDLPWLQLHALGSHTC